MKKPMNSFGNALKYVFQASTVIRRTTSVILAAFLFGQILAQNAATTDFYTKIKNYDLSTVLTADSFLAEDRESSKDKIERAEILGFIGDDYQRFYIHFISVIQNPTKPYEYFLYGKTKVKETICTFQGSLTIMKARIYNEAEISKYKQGFTICDVILYEDKKQPSTGYIKGKLKSEFLIDNKGQFRYDALMFPADGFSNNQFIGTWTSYKTNITKKCNWGDYRIPECGDLDIGAGEFSVNEKYIKNGWLGYRLESIKPNGEQSKADKNKKWWE